MPRRLRRPVEWGRESSFNASLRPIGPHLERFGYDFLTIALLRASRVVWPWPAPSASH
jgi:hypothetical protein